jgi:hypothetical protein
VTQRVHKFELHAGWNELLLNLPCQQLSVAPLRELNGPEGLFLWALVDPAEELVPQKVYVAMTGEELPLLGIGRFIGTVVMHADRVVAHVFEGTESA